MPLATGEEVPQGHSIRARLLIIEVAYGDVDLATLSECQRAGEDGHLAASMGAFLGWIAGRYEELQQRLQARSREIPGQGLGRAIHSRLGLIAICSNCRTSFWPLSCQRFTMTSTDIDARSARDRRE